MPQPDREVEEARIRETMLRAVYTNTRHELPGFDLHLQSTKGDAEKGDRC